MTTVHIHYRQLYTISFSMWRKLNTSLKVICIQASLLFSPILNLFVFRENIVGQFCVYVICCSSSSGIMSREMGWRPLKTIVKVLRLNNSYRSSRVDNGQSSYLKILSIFVSEVNTILQLIRPNE